MSKVIENKQLIHLAAEVVVVIGLTFYFNTKHKKIKEHVAELSQRLEEQDQIIEKHEQTIRQIVQNINQRPSDLMREQKHKPKPPKIPNTKRKGRRANINKRHIKPPLSFSEPERTGIEVSFNDNDEIIEEENTDEEDSELDAEIAEELEELKDSPEFGLKKNV